MSTVKEVILAWMNAIGLIGLAGCSSGKLYYYSRYEDKSARALNETVCPYEVGEDPRSWDFQAKFREKVCYQRVYVYGKSKAAYTTQGDSGLDSKLTVLRNQARKIEVHSDGTAHYTNIPH